MRLTSAAGGRTSTGRAGWAAPIALLFAGLVVLLGACGSSGVSQTREVSFSGSALPNVDPANSRHEIGGPIDSASVSELEVAWSLPLKAAEAHGKTQLGGVIVPSTYGGYSSSPVVSNGVIYSQDLESNVQAIGLESGDVLWEKRYGLANRGPNGVVVTGDRVYGATPASAFALDRETGEQIWSVKLTRNENEGINMAPGYEEGKVFVSTAPGTLRNPRGRGGVGVLWALDARTGRKLWHFDTVPRSLWGNRRGNSGGGLWHTPAFDGEGAMYFSVAGPGPIPGTRAAPWGSSRPGPNLYTNSVVKLDTESGELRWHFQLNPHDLYDWDLVSPPMLIEAGGRELVVAAGKSGIVFALEAASGQLVWKHPLGRRNGHEKDASYAMRGEYSKLKLIPTLYPGNQGGVAAPMSTDGSRVFVPVVNHPVSVPGAGTEIREYSKTNLGEVAALDVRTGAVQWKRKLLVSPMLGATSSVNDLVFTTSTRGKVYAFSADNGKIAWQAELPLGTNTGITVSEDTVIAPAGLASAPEDEIEIVAYRLEG
jgi:outer membrane protein assembly factor BamB